MRYCFFARFSKRWFVVVVVVAVVVVVLCSSHIEMQMTCSKENLKDLSGLKMGQSKMQLRLMKPNAISFQMGNLCHLSVFFLGLWNNITKNVLIFKIIHLVSGIRIPTHILIL